jgi:hypothetical protein
MTMSRNIKLSVVLVAAVALAGCNQSNGPQANSDGNTPGFASNNQYLLPTEPSGAKAVKEVRKEAKDGDPVIVVGRIGGSTKPFVEGRAVFTIVDSSLVPCSDREGDTCSTPWDYCCDSHDDIARSSLLVRFVDAEEKTITQDAQTLLGVSPLQTVIVRGRAKRDTNGNIVVLASGLHVRSEKPKRIEP